MARTQHITARQVNATWLGWTLTATNRDDGQTITGGLSDYQHDTAQGHTTLYMGGHTVSLRASDTVTCDQLGLLGGASA